MTDLQKKTIELQLEDFKKRVSNWIDNRSFQLDVNEWAVANEILTKYMSSKKILLIENEDSSYEFHNAMNDIIIHFNDNPASQRQVIESIFRYVTIENLVCNLTLLKLIFPNIDGELGIEYTISMTI